MVDDDCLQYATKHKDPPLIPYNDSHILLVDKCQSIIVYKLDTYRLKKPQVVRTSAVFNYGMYYNHNIVLGYKTTVLIF